jgi:hypothetical protein
MRGRSSRYFRIPEKAHRNGVSVRIDGTEGGPEHGDEDRCNRPRQHDRHAGALRQRTRIAAEPSVAAGVLMVPPFLAQLRGREAGALAVQ